MPRDVEDELAADYLRERQADTSTVYDVPSEASLDGEFAPAPDIERIAARLILRHQMTPHNTCNIVYLWKDKGGKSHGSAVYGKATKPSGLLRHFSECDFVIWLAADHLRECGATVREVEAVVYHELRHIASDENDDPCLTGHEYAGFLAELKEYGTTVRDLKPILRIAQQMEMPLGE